MSGYQVGELVDITIKGVRVSTVTFSGLVTIQDEHGDPYPMPPQAAIERVAPANWPPRLGDLWQDDGERAYFVADIRVDYSDDDMPDLRMIAQWGEQLDPDVAMRKYGLTLVRRHSSQGGEQG